MWLLDELEKRKDSDDIAIRYMDEFITYREMWHRSECIADYLYKHGLTENPLVIYGSKEIDIVPCMHAALKVGIPYVPIDTLYPINRLEKIANSVAANVVIDFSGNVEMPCDVLEQSDLQSIYNERNFGGVERDKWLSRDEDIAYILFTSGSTGVPKGVPITKGNLINFASWFKHYLPIAPGKSMTINQAPYSFDLSVIGLFVCLPLGSCLLNIDKAISSDFNLLDEYMLTYQPDIWISTPSVARTCLFDDMFIKNTMNCIRQFIFDGEILAREVVQELFVHYQKAQIINAYGPTEATVAIAACEITQQMLEDDRALPIGYPLTDGRVEIIADGKQVEENEIGELFISSKSVANGYWHSPEQTKASFSREAGGCNRYATGDLVYQQNGLLYYIGRKDNQIKLNGYRIELSDIECNLQNLDYIRDCCVVPKASNGKVEFLCAFVALAKTQEKNLKTIMQIKKDLAGKIPIYMVPKKIVLVDRLPLNVNGKIDRKKLLEEL